jgi:hypothetical protein
VLLEIWLRTVEKVRHNWPLDKPATVLFIWGIPSEIYKPAVTLEEALQLRLPAMQPTVQVYNSAEDSVKYRGRMEMTEDEEYMKFANRED